LKRRCGDDHRQGVGGTCWPPSPGD
jgi:hypothetical protein